MEDIIRVMKKTIEHQNNFVSLVYICLKQDKTKQKLAFEDKFNLTAIS